MINPLSPSASSPLQVGKTTAVAPTAPVKAAGGTRTSATTVTRPAAAMAAAGPPVDVAKIGRIKAAIADGTYQTDSSAIADRMVDLDMPERA